MSVICAGAHSRKIKIRKESSSPAYIAIGIDE
jgi:hypothetical protein